MPADCIMLLACVQGGSTYTIVTGYPSGERAESGTPSSLVCLASGTLCGLAEGARSEHKDSKVAVSEINLRCTLHKEVGVVFHVKYVACAQIGVFDISSLVRKVVGLMFHIMHRQLCLTSAVLYTKRWV